jgi:hypothetical protein
MSAGLVNEHPQTRWHPWTRIAFRFAFLYLLLLNLPFPLNAFPYVDRIAQPYSSLWTAIVTRTARVVLGREIPSVFNGSGDRTYDYLLAACLLVLAVVGTILWSLLDRKRLSYSTLYRWLHVYVRFALGTAMIGYGAFKVISSQFPPPTLDRLMQPFGDASPMGLLWTFMGASEPYTMFVGFAEMISGILLFPRRTSGLGALMSVGVLSNVVALNFSYDVPVKLYSSHLLAMALFVLIPDARRLANVFLLNRAAQPVTPKPLFRKTVWNRGALTLGSLFLVLVLGTSLYQSYDQRRSFIAQRSPLYGVWEVEEFNLGEAESAAPIEGWRRVIFDSPFRLAVQTSTDAQERFRLQMDEQKGTLTLRKREDPNWQLVLTYQQVNPGVLTLTGEIGGSQLTARLRRKDEQLFLLTNRGFHWINEVPFNR